MPVAILAVTPDGKRAVSGTWKGEKYGDFEEVVDAPPTHPFLEEGVMKLWDLEGKWTTRLLRRHTMPVTAVDLTPDGLRAISGSYGRLVRVWDLGTGDELHVLRGHSGIVWSVAMTPDGRFGASASEDGTVKAWNLENGQLIATFTCDSEMRSCSISPDGSILVGRDSSGRIHILRLDQVVREYRLTKEVES